MEQLYPIGQQDVSPARGIYLSGQLLRSSLLKGCSKAPSRCGFLLVAATGMPYKPVTLEATSILQLLQQAAGPSALGI